MHSCPRSFLSKTLCKIISDIQREAFSLLLGRRNTVKVQKFKSQVACAKQFQLKEDRKGMKEVGGDSLRKHWTDWASNSWVTQIYVFAQFCPSPSSLPFFLRSIGAGVWMCLCVQKNEGGWGTRCDTIILSSQRMETMPFDGKGACLKTNAIISAKDRVHTWEKCHRSNLWRVKWNEAALKSQEAMCLKCKKFNDSNDSKDF